MNRRNAVDWAHTTNIYEVNVRQYTPEGTFVAFGKHLPRLRDMAVETLWFMPITPISQKNKKGELGSQYACSDYTAINPEFGDLGDFRQLVQEAHRLGFKVIIDWVANHTGWDHVWTKEHPDYYHHDPSTHDFKTASGMDDIIELNYSNSSLRRDMIAAMQYWVTETDIDGFRCDLAAWVVLDFWQEARPQLDAVKHLFWLGEFDELDHPGYGEVFDASYCWKWMHTSEDFYRNHLHLDVLVSLLGRYGGIGDQSMRAWFTSNHDENSWNGTEYEKYGNMAHALAVFSVTWNGVPLIYNGQEIPLLAKRLHFFQKDAIPWTDTFGLHDFYKILLTLHSTHPALRGGDPAVRTLHLHTTDEAHVLAYLRTNADRQVLVLLNFSGSSPVHFHLKEETIGGVYKDVFSGATRDFSQDREIEMQAWEYRVYSK